MSLVRYASLRAVVACSFVSAGLSSAVAQGLELLTPENLAAPGEVEVQVIGGMPLDPADWPATLIFRNRGGGGCTATAVGERVILTAAHCVDNGATGTAKVKGTSIEISCHHHPDYQPPQSVAADFALCLTQAPMPSLPFEVINTDPASPAMDESVQLLGYGCLTEGGADNTFGSLFGGQATVVRLREFGLYTVTEGGAALCFGDSGGGAFQSDDVSRRLFAVNSRGNISTHSWLSTTSAPAFLGWAEDWALIRDVQICGLMDDAAGCAPQ